MEEMTQRERHAQIPMSQSSSQATRRPEKDTLFITKRRPASKLASSQGGPGITAQQPWGKIQGASSQKPSSGKAMTSSQEAENLRAVAESSRQGREKARVRSKSASSSQPGSSRAAYEAKYGKKAVMTNGESSDDPMALGYEKPAQKRERSPVKKSVSNVVSEDEESDAPISSGKASNSGKGRARGEAKATIYSSKPEDKDVLKADRDKAGIKSKSAEPGRTQEDWFAEIMARRSAGFKGANAVAPETTPRKASARPVEPSSTIRTVVEPNEAVQLANAVLRDLSTTTVKRRRAMFAGLSDADVEFCESVLDPEKQCPYCSEPMPREPSRNLLRLQEDLEKISTSKPTPTNLDARRAPWEQTINFCAQHKAESTVIPLGRRRGFPVEVNFDDLARRVDSSHLWRAITAMCRDPQEMSTWFRATTRKIEKQGKRTWQSMAEQSKQRRMDLIQPGYYGDTGKLALTRHFQRRFQIGDLPALDRVAPGSRHPIIYPLSADEFIINILVPEAATFLIMEDQGWTGRSFLKSEPGWGQARERAFETLRASIEYGRALHGEDQASLPDNLIGDIQRRQTQVAFPAYVPSPSRSSQQPQVILSSPCTSQELAPNGKRRRTTPDASSPGSHMSDLPSLHLSSSRLSSSARQATPQSDDIRGRIDIPQSSSPAAVTLNHNDWIDPDEDRDMCGSDSETVISSDSDGDVRALGSQLSKGSLKQQASYYGPEFEVQDWEQVMPREADRTTLVPASDDDIIQVDHPQPSFSRKPLTTGITRRIGLTPQR